MKIFKELRGMFSADSGRNEGWNVPETEEDLKHVFGKNSGVHLIYKHSYACGTCLFTLKQIEKIKTDSSVISGWHFIDVIKNRPVSIFAATESGIRHESPQAILLKNGEVIWHGSHSSVTADNISEALIPN